MRSAARLHLSCIGAAARYTGPDKFIGEMR